MKLVATFAATLLSLPMAARAADTLPAPRHDIVLECTLRQSGPDGVLRFARRLDIRRRSYKVSMQDDLGSGFTPVKGDGTLLTAGPEGISYRFSWPQGTATATFDWESSKYRSVSGPVTVEGWCHEPKGYRAPVIPLPAAAGRG